jgi:vacuolar-type H+-ATPase subunit H
VSPEGAHLEFLELIDELEQLVLESRRLPVGGNLVVDRRRLLDLIDQLRLAIPADLKQARQILEARQQIIDDAHLTARRTMERAEQERARMIDEHTVTRAAEERAQQLLMDAEARARQIVAEADATAAAHLSEAAEATRQELENLNRYTREVLGRVERLLTQLLGSVQENLEQLDREAD